MRALVIGLGQDGTYLAEHLTALGHDVHTGTRRPRTGAAHVDLLDQNSIERTLYETEPDVVFNCAAVTAPGGTWDTTQPPLLADVTGLGVIRLLDAMCKAIPTARLVHASSSAVYDPARYGLYGAAKLLAHQAIVGYRDAGLLACSNAILYSHTSPRQDPRFLARRVATAAARLAAGSDRRIILTDLDYRRDWGDARDHVRALACIATAPPGDYVVATGRTHTVRDLVEAALAAVGLDWDAAVTVVAGPRAAPETPADIADVTALGWAPEWTFADTIRSLVAAAPMDEANARYHDRHE